MSAGSSFPESARTALADSQLRRNLGHATRTIRAKRAAAVAEVPDWEELREAGRALQERSLRHLVPAALDWPQAGGAPEVLTTAHDALFSRARLQPGERLLVHGGAGGVGTAAVQLARAAGARVIATVRRGELRGEVEALGAKVIAPEGFEEHGPFEVILELVGGPNLAGDLKALATGGRIAVIGVGAGARAELDLLALMGKRAQIQGSTLRARPLEQKAEAVRRVESHVLPFLEDGKIRVPVSETFPLERAHEAYERFAAGGKLGKIVLEVATAPGRPGPGDRPRL